MMAWKSDPKCAKCRRTSPTMEWAQWVPFLDTYMRSPMGRECLRLTCVRCGFQWLMELAPVDQPVRAPEPAPVSA